jgi:hypothetical protein
MKERRALYALRYFIWSMKTPAELYLVVLNALRDFFWRSTALLMPVASEHHPSSSKVCLDAYMQTPLS